MKNEGQPRLRVGFTGTRHGMTPAQTETFVATLRELEASLGPLAEFHHGDCVGADAEAHCLVRLHFRECYIILHPPIDEAHRARRVGS